MHYIQTGSTLQAVVQVDMSKETFSVTLPAKLRSGYLSHIDFNFCAGEIATVENIYCSDRNIEYTCNIVTPSSEWYPIILRGPGPLPYADGSAITIRIDTAKIIPRPRGARPGVPITDPDCNYITAYYIECQFIGGASVEAREGFAVIIDENGKGMTVQSKR